jgi:amidase
MAIGGDQGGSIRMPSAYCGIVGLKPTWGLVPYTGIMPIELTLDHTGPMTASVADNALMLETIAGPDGLDPRQMGCTVDTYTKALGGSASGLKIGVVKEGFGHAQSEKVVDELVKKGAAKFKELGAVVEEVSIPWHLTGMAVWSAIAVEGATWQMMLGNGYGFNWKGLYVTSLVDAHSAWRERADELSDTLKTTILFGKYALNKYRGHYYAKAQNLARKLAGAYDAALAKYDLLLMPTLPLRATKLPDPAGPRMDIINRAFEMLPNTAPFDVTGHPAITLPCGMSEGLPAGMMLIGKHWNESTIYRAADAYEKSHDWKKVTA